MATSKVFAKLNENHLLMANIFKLHQYQTFGLMKIHNMCKIRFANNIFSEVREIKFVKFVVLKILENLVSIENSLNAHNCKNKPNF